jgi:hypothetical protein
LKVYKANNLYKHHKVGYTVALPIVTNTGNYMNKPNWTQAPEWAQHLARDSDGTWWWFEHTPFADPASREWKTVRGRSEMAAPPSNIWKDSLRHRPDPTTIDPEEHALETVGFSLDPVRAFVRLPHDEQLIIYRAMFPERNHMDKDAIRLTAAAISYRIRRREPLFNYSGA